MANGGSWTSYLRDRKAQQLAAMSKRAYRRIEAWTLQEAKLAAERTCDSIIHNYHEQAEDAFLVLSGDFGWSQRRNASAGVYTVIDSVSGKVVHQIILTKSFKRLVNGEMVTVRKGNYFGTSKGMEGEAFRQMVDWLEEKRLLPCLRVFVCDQDSSVLSQLSKDPRLAKVRVVHDPGHTKKNFVKDLHRAFGTYRGMAERIGRWFMWAIKESKKRVDKQGITDQEQRQAALVQEFTWRMQCGQAHYFSPLCDVGCPCYTPEDISLPEDKGEGEAEEEEVEEGDSTYDDVRVLEDEVWADEEDASNEANINTQTPTSAVVLPILFLVAIILVET